MEIWLSRVLLCFHRQSLFDALHVIKTVDLNSYQPLRSVGRVSSHEYNCATARGLLNHKTVILASTIVTIYLRSDWLLRTGGLQVDDRSQ